MKKILYIFAIIGVLTLSLSSCATTQTNEEYEESQKLFNKQNEIFD